jgi:hypothetical protein
MLPKEINFNNLIKIPVEANQATEPYAPERFGCSTLPLHGYSAKYNT